MVDYFKPETNVKSDERILVIKTMDGQKPKNSVGLIEPRLFTGENSIIAEKVPGSVMWKLRYKFGVAPQEFNQSFTSFPKLLDFVKRYFAKRNCEIVEVKD